MAKGIKVATETIRESRVIGLKGKESWWWNANIQDNVKVKNDCFKAWSLCKNVENFEKYKVTRKDTKKVVRKARAKALDRLY